MKDECQAGACVHPPGNDGASCLDDGNECRDDVCDGGACTHPPRPDCTGCANDWCIGSVCVPETCSIALSDGEACPGGVAHVIVGGICGPECITSMLWSITSSSPLITGTGGSVSCAGKSVPATLSVSPQARPGPIPITITGTTPGGTQCSSSATVNVVRPDIAFASVDEAAEETVGGFVCSFDDDVAPLLGDAP